MIISSNEADFAYFCRLHPQTTRWDHACTWPPCSQLPTQWSPVYPIMLFVAPKEGSTHPTYGANLMLKYADLRNVSVS